MFYAFAYAEISSRDPNAGNAYATAYAALLELPAFLASISLALEYGVSLAAVARF